MPDARQLWRTALGELQLLMTRANFDTWFAGTEGLGFDGGTLRVGVKSAFTREALSIRFAPLVNRTLANLGGAPQAVRYEPLPEDSASEAVLLPRPAEEAPAPPQKRSSRRPRTSAAFQAAGAIQEAPLPTPLAGAPLNPRYTFSSFVEAESNRLAYGAALAVAEAPGQDYNPLFIYGGVGLGKTHLLHAIGNAALARGVPVVYVSSETFTNDLINAIRDHRNDEFRQKYRRCGLLLIDDIQTLEGKERTQEEFFHTFNAIHGGGGHIVITSDRPPSDIPRLEERLRSRFAWGLIADIQLPDFETRVAILRAKVRSRDLSFPPEVLDLIAQRAQSSVRELEGCLNRVLAQARLQGSPPSLETVALALDAVSSERGAPRSDEILSAVCGLYGVSLEELRGKQRDRRIVLPRQLAMYLLREESHLSMPEIGRRLGGRDHTTVLHGTLKIGSALDHDPRLRADLQLLREQLRLR